MQSVHAHEASLVSKLTINLICFRILLGIWQRMPNGGGNIALTKEVSKQIL